MHTINRKTCLIILFIFLAMAIIVQPSFASPKINTESNVSIEIQYAKNGNVIRNAEFYVYRIADVSPYVEFAVVDEFADYNIKIDGLDTEGWRNVAYTLEGYIKRDNINAFKKGVTDTNGRIVFTDKNMTAGLYLIIGEKCTYNEKIYTPEPFIVCVPDRNEDDEWIYNTVVQPEASIEVVVDNYIDLNVIKVWKDKNSTKRPERIEVQLLKDGKVYDTVKLNKNNNWKYTWHNLNSRYEWKAVEKKVPEKYTVTSVRENDTFVITNTIASQGGEAGKLPQTGVMWWPCFVLFILGAISLSIGIICRRRYHEKYFK